MRKLLLLLGALCVCAAATARPKVIESTAHLPAYSEDFDFAGDYLLNARSGPISGIPPDEVFETVVELFQRGTDGKWTLARELANEQGSDYGASVAMATDVAAFTVPSGLQIWERSATGWARVLTNPVSMQNVAAHIVGNSLLTTLADPGACSNRAAIVSRGTNGVWAQSAEFPPVPAGSCIVDSDFDEGRAILGVHDANAAIDRAMIYERSGSSWNLVATLSPQDGSKSFATQVAVKGSLAVVSASERGSHLYQRTTVGWEFTGFLPHQDQYDGAQQDYELSLNDQYLVKSGTNINRRTTVAEVYKRLPDDTFEHVANLARGNNFGFSHALIRGTRVIGGRPDLYEFNLPSSFSVATPEQDDFESGAAARWTTLPGSQFAIVNNGHTHVWRQSNSTGDGGAIYSADLTNQSVSADVRPITWGGTGSGQFLALVTRYIDSGNYYYLQIRADGYLALKKAVNGAFTELGRVRMPGTQPWHRLGLESTGTLHNVYADGQLVLWAFDTTHKHGHPAIRTSRASADFDNVVVTPGPQASLSANGRSVSGGVWEGNWLRSGSVGSIVQTQADSGDARAISGLPRKDNVVQAAVTFRAGAPTGSPWAGLIVRYVDSRNYYYVTVRANELSLRKLTNGAVTILDSEPFTRQTGVPVNLKMEAVRDKVRVYVNDELRLETSGATIVPGRVGLMTSRASAAFDNYFAYEP